MDPWSEILDRIWYYLEEGPKSSAIAELIPPANRYRYDKELTEPAIPTSERQSILIVDQTGGRIDLNYSPLYILAEEDYQISIWTAGMSLRTINDLRFRVLAAIVPALPDLGLEFVLDTKLNVGRIVASLDKIERDADGRLMTWRDDLRRWRRRSVLLEMRVSFLIDRSSL